MAMTTGGRSEVNSHKRPLISRTGGKTQAFVDKEENRSTNTGVQSSYLPEFYRRIPVPPGPERDRREIHRCRTSATAKLASRRRLRRRLTLVLVDAYGRNREFGQVLGYGERLVCKGTVPAGKAMQRIMLTLNYGEAKIRRFFNLKKKFPGRWSGNWAGQLGCAVAVICSHHGLGILGPDVKSSTLGGVEGVTVMPSPLGKSSPKFMPIVATWHTYVLAF